MTHHMTLLELSDQQHDTYVQNPDPLTYGILGLGGETGEVQEKYKKLMRTMTPMEVPHAPEAQELLLELGDVLWYVIKVAKELGSTLEEVALMNVEKLREREVGK